MKLISRGSAIVDKNLTKMQVFLDMFKSHLDNQGYVLDKDNQKIGDVDFVSNKKVKKMKSVFTCKNGLVRANSYLDDCCVDFSIVNNKQKQRQKGMIVFSCEEDSVNEDYTFKFLRMSLTSYKKNIETNNIRLYCDDFCFYYENYLTGLELSFSPFLGGTKFEYKKIMGNIINHISISIDEVNSRINQVFSYNELGDNFDITDETISKINSEDNIWHQMSTIISYLCPEFYQDLEQIIDTYDNPGVNLVKEMIRKVDLEEEILKGCFGKELVKRISFECK